MKKILFSLMALLSINTIVFAGNTDILGEWIITTAEMGGETQNVYQLTKFKTDGYAEMQGRVFGKWKYDDKSNTLIIESEMIKEFAGNWKVTADGKSKLTLKTDKSTLNLVKYDAEKIKKDNKKSGLNGVWKLNEKNDEDADVYLNFQDTEMSILYIAPGVTGRDGGLWIYNPAEKTVVMMVRDRMLRGMSKIKTINDKTFEIENNGHKIGAVKLEQNAKNRETIALEEMDDDGDDENSAELDPEFSWYDYEKKIENLKNVKTLKYIKSTLLQGLDVFAQEKVSAEVSFDENNYVITIGQLFDGLSTDDNDRENIFYPIEELNYYTVIGEKTITVPAGTFKCMVIEAENDFGNGKNRYYLINDLPGVYAKIIIAEKEFDKEKYTMYELAEIVGDVKEKQGE
jgi:hypothetical protein